MDNVCAARGLSQRLRNLVNRAKGMLSDCLKQGDLRHPALLGCAANMLDSIYFTCNPYDLADPTKPNPYCQPLYEARKKFPSSKQPTMYTSCPQSGAWRMVVCLAEDASLSDPCALIHEALHCCYTAKPKPRMGPFDPNKKEVPESEYDIDDMVRECCSCLGYVGYGPRPGAG
jgi:hypothetical protein